MITSGCVYIVHAVDTEGPLYESKEATQTRIREIFGCEYLELKNDPLKFNHYKKVFSPHLQNYITNVDDLNTLLEKKIFNKKWRSDFLDSNNDQWITTWHCLDWVNFSTNPRRRVEGFHKIFDLYNNHIQNSELNDEIQFHFHPTSISRSAHHNSQSIFKDTKIFDILCRRVIDRQFFPNSFRAGFHIERPDLNWFLEQWIPYDLSNINQTNKSNLQADLSEGRGGDWRSAPTNWEIYNPSHDDYSQKGYCRRFIGRVLNIKGRHSAISEEEIGSAFNSAKNGSKVLLGLTGHDFRDLSKEIEYAYDLISKISRIYNVPFYFRSTSNGFIDTLNLNQSGFQLKANLLIKKNEKILQVNELKGSCFGPQPFLCFKLKDGRYIHDNFDFSNKTKPRSWSYTFTENTLSFENIEKIGIASNSLEGDTFVKVFCTENLT